MNRIRRKLVLVLLLIAFCISGAMAETTDSAYQKYLAAYKAYQEAVTAQKPAGEVEKARQAYSVAKDTYVGTLPGNPSKSAASSTLPETTSSGAVSSSLTVPPLTTAQPMTDPYSDNATFTPDIQPLIDCLKSERAGSYADSIFIQIKSYLQANPNCPDKSKIQYELAKAYERLRNDQASALALYKEIAADPNSGRFGIYANLRIKYLGSFGDRTKWKKSLSQKFEEMNAAYRKYKDTSWLLAPVKMVRWATYLAKSIAFLRAQNDEADFELYYEALGAPFTPPPEEIFDQYAARIASGPPDDNARVRLVYKNYEAWYSRWKLLSDAQSTIDMTYFIIDNDVFGTSLLGLLLKKANEGVKIRLMIDCRGSNKFSLGFWAQDFLQELVRRGNVEVKIYNPMETNIALLLTDLRRVISSNHDKIIVVDRRFAIIGGRNIANEYLVDPIDDPEAWRDCDVVIDSEEVAREMETAFTEEFQLLKAFKVKKAFLGGTESYGWEMEAAGYSMDLYLHGQGVLDAKKVPDDIEPGVTRYNKELTKYRHMTGFPAFDPFSNAYDAPVQILDKHSLSGPRNDITESIVRFIDGSRKEIIIQNPYIVLTPRAQAALKRASKRGVPIYIHTNSPQTSDSFPTEAMLLRDWRTYLKDMPTCRLFARVNEGQLHAKNFVFDGKVGLVGTYNFDYLSEKVNSEVVAMIKSDEFASELRKEIFSDMAKSVEYHLATADSPEFGPADVQGAKKLWLIKLISKMGWLKPLF